jgi:hypothetical protein
LTLQSNTPSADLGGDSPVVETTTTEESAPVAATESAAAELDATAAPASDADSSAADVETSAAPVAEAPADIDTDTDTPAEWNGELGSLTSAEWFLAGVAEPVRKTLVNGIQAKYRNLEGGFTRKTQALAADRKSLAEREASLSNELTQYKRWLDTGEDLGTQALQEADNLRAQLTAATAAREQAEVDLRAQLAAEHATSLTAVEQERETLRAELAETRRASDEAEAARNEEVLGGLTAWITKTAPKLWDDENEEALGLLLHQLETGATADPAVALRIVGAVHAKFGAPVVVAEEVPEALEVMNNDSSTSFGNGAPAPGNEPYAAMKARLEKEALALTRGG